EAGAIMWLWSWSMVKMMRQQIARKVATIASVTWLSVHGFSIGWRDLPARMDHSLETADLVGSGSKRLRLRRPSAGVGRLVRHAQRLQHRQRRDCRYGVHDRPDHEHRMPASGRRHQH